MLTVLLFQLHSAVYGRFTQVQDQQLGLMLTTSSLLTTTAQSTLSLLMTSGTMVMKQRLLTGQTNGSHSVSQMTFSVSSFQHGASVTQSLQVQLAAKAALHLVSGSA